MLVRFAKTFVHYVKATRSPHDFVWLGFYGHPLTFFARWFTRKPIILDAWLSSYETMVNARQNFLAQKIGFLFKALDRFAVSNVDVAVFPSEGEKNYYIDRLGVKSAKLDVVWVGVNEDVFKPSARVKKKAGKTIVLFSGTFLPISGVRVVVEAAELLKNNSTIEFWLAGNGQTYEADKNWVEERKLTNVHFLGRKPYREIPTLMQEADICLGIFGDGDKANRILPTKIYEANAMSLPCITAKSDGVSELLENGKSVIFVPPRDAQALASAIVDLTKHPAKAKKIGEAGHSVFLAKATPVKIGRKILEIVKRIKPGPF